MRDQLRGIYENLGSFTEAAELSLIENSLQSKECILITTSVSEPDESKRPTRSDNNGRSLGSSFMANTPKMQRLQFVRGSSLFLKLSDDLAPFAFSAQRSHNALLGDLELLLRLGVRRYPSLTEIVQWSVELSRDYKQGPLPRKQLNVAVRLAKLAHEVIIYSTDSSMKQIAGLYLPDQSGILRLASSNLFVDDAPWLQGRIDCTKVPLIHPEVDKVIAVGLGARPLSSAVTEIANPSDIEEARLEGLPKETRESIVKWNRNLSTPAFQGAVRRAMVHFWSKQMSSRSSGASRNSLSSDTNLRLSMLSKGKIVFARKIPTYFYLENDSSATPYLDITLQNQGERASALASLVVYNERGVHVSSEKAGTPVIYLLLEQSLAGGLKSGWQLKW